MTEYEFRLVTQVTRGEEGSGFMGNMVLDYVVLGTWTDTDTDTSDTTGELTLEVMNSDLAREAMAKANTKHVKVIWENGINFRSSPNDETADNIIGQIPLDTELDVVLLNESEIWVSTTYNDKSGYIKIRSGNIPFVQEVEKTKEISYYELLLTKPSDWETNYTSYFTRNMDGTFSPVEGIPDPNAPATPETPAETPSENTSNENQSETPAESTPAESTPSTAGTVAPPWKENKYYRYIQNQQTNGEITTGALIKIKQSAENYYNLQVAIPQWVKDNKWYVLCVTNSERVVIDASEDGKYHIMSPVHIKDCELVNAPNTSTTSTESSSSNTTEGG